LERSPGKPHPGLFLHARYGATHNENWKRTKTILGGLRDGNPRRLCGLNAAGDQFVSANDIRKSPTLLVVPATDVMAITKCLISEPAALV
jgi:hypothetical protein